MTDKEVNIMSEIRRGDIWMVDFGVPEDENDHKLHGIRPVVIVSNDSASDTARYSMQYRLQVRFIKRHICQHIFLSVRLRLLD